MRMPLLDVAFYLLDSAHSPQDFTLILHFTDPPSVDGLRAGAQSALNRFPVSGCTIERRKWIWRDDAEFKLECTSAVETLVDQPFDVRHQIPVKQWFDVFLQAFRENLGATGNLIARLFFLGAYLICGEEQRHQDDADNQGQDDLQCRAHSDFPLGTLGISKENERRGRG